MLVFGASMTKWKERVNSAHLNAKIKYLASIAVECFNFFRKLVTVSKFVSKFVQEYNTKICKDKLKKYEIMLWYYHVTSCYFCKFDGSHPVVYCHLLC